MNNDELIERFTRYLRAECGRSENTIGSYRIDLEKFSAHMSRAFAPISRTDLREYIAYMIDQGKSGNTAARHLATLRSFYKFLIDEGEITQNPTRNIPVPKTWKKLPKSVSIEELEKMVAHCDQSWLGIRDRAMLLALFGSGFRVSELIALKLQDVDLVTGIAKIWNGKGGKDGVVLISPRALVALKAYIVAIRPRFANVCPHCKAKIAKAEIRYLSRDSMECPRCHGTFVPAQHVFLGRRGPLTRQQICYRINSISKAALGRRASPHQLRHGFATALVEGGADIRDVQALLRHAYVDTTQIYIHTDLTYLRSGYDASHPRARITAKNREFFDLLPSPESQSEHGSRLPRRSLGVGRAIPGTAHHQEAGQGVPVASA